MSCEIYDVKDVVTRKRHVCAYCGRPIEPRTSGVRVESGLYDGEFFRRYACTECKPLVNDFWGYVDGESGGIQLDFSEYLLDCHPDLIKDDNDD